MIEPPPIAISESIYHISFFSDTLVDDDAKRIFVSAMCTHVRIPTNLTSIVDGRIFAFTFNEKEYVLKKFRNVGDKDAEIRHLRQIADIKFMVPFCYVRLTSVLDDINNYILIMHKKPVLHDVILKLISNIPNQADRELIVKHIFFKYMLQLYILAFHHELAYSDIKALNFAIEIAIIDDNFTISIFFMDYGSICSSIHPSCLFTYPHNVIDVLSRTMLFAKKTECAPFANETSIITLMQMIKEINHGGLLILLQMLGNDISHFHYRDCRRQFPQFMPLSPYASIVDVLNVMMYAFFVDHYVTDENVLAFIKSILWMNSPKHEYFQLTTDEIAVFNRIQKSTKSKIILVLSHNERNTNAVKALFGIIYPTLVFEDTIVVSSVPPPVAPPPVIPPPVAPPVAPVVDQTIGQPQVAVGGSNKQIFDKYKEYKTKYLLLKQQMSHK